MSSYHGWTHRPKALGGTDPIQGVGVANPWVLIADGFTTAPTDTWMPVPFTQFVYDPALVTLGGGVFDRDTTDTGDTGNTRYRIKTSAKGVFYCELWTAWDQVTTDGLNDFGYAVQDMFHTAAPASIISGNEYSRASADWPKNAATSDHEMLDNPFLFSAFTVFLNAARTWDPYAKQTTGVDRGLSGMRLYVEKLPHSDPAGWTYDSV